MTGSPTFTASSAATPPPEAIALIGIGCRFPGAANVEAFWNFLTEGRETVRDYPGGRFKFLDDFYAKGGAASRRGGFLGDLDRFDAAFFGISPREAALLDPQQRLLLETAWEAIEDAGIPPAKLAGTRTSIFAGLWSGDYEDCLYQLTPAREFHASLGGGRYAASGRLAFWFDIRGPALTIDTACSSSLVAIHLACKSLLSGESEMALAGGANVILAPEITRMYSAVGMLSPDGRCKFGDASANGYVRSEGAGMVLLKPLDRALADGDPVYAVIRGSAVNNDGRSSGQLVSPSREAQETLFRAALADAKIRADEIDYIEAHGTGTRVGDPVEIEAIGRVMKGRERGKCRVGSVKTNIGHTEAAAGIAGLIKTALSLDRGFLPPSLHFETPNPDIPWSVLPVEVQAAASAWPKDRETHFAGVNAFGITGTNAHVVLQNAPEIARPAQPSKEIADRAHLFVLSGHTPAALQAQIDAWRERVLSDRTWPGSLRDLAYTAAVRRTHHPYRFAFTAETREELEEKLRAAVIGTDDAQGGGACGIAFVFPGQGGQWIGMGRDLWVEEPVFAQALKDCDAAIKKLTGWSVIEKMLGSDPAVVEEIDVVQPLLFALMYSLAALWRSWGVECAGVVGHSMGEAAAAAVSGALSVDDASAVICHRSRLMKAASGKGLMAIAELTLEDAEKFVSGYGGRISVAASNSPTSVVLAGDADQVEKALGQLEAREVFCRRIKVNLASHCAHMDPYCQPLLRALDGIEPRVSTIPFYSTVDGAIVDGASLGPEYWSRNLRQTVLFSTAIQKMIADGFDTFVEINAHPVLLHDLEAGMRHSGRRAVVTGSLRRGESSRRHLLESIGALHVNGYPVDFTRLYPSGRCLRLPPIVWQRERFWIEDQGTREDRRAAVDVGGHIYEVEWRPASDRPIGSATTRNVVCGPYRADSLSDAPGIVMDVVTQLRALSADHAPGATRLWLISAGAWKLAGDTHLESPAQAALWGLGRVIAREHPELCCSNVDLSAGATPDELETLQSVLSSGRSDEWIAIRGGRIFAGRYRRGPSISTGAVSVGAPKFEAEAAYLITGGSGGIGLELARWLASRGARQIALVARHSASTETLRQISAIEESGARVRLFEADVADREQVAEALGRIRKEMAGPLRGIFHLAAATEGALAVDVTAEQFDRVMGAKAMGAWNLHMESLDDKLDHFVLFSSVAAAISQPGQAAYASANAIVDGIARLRRSEGLPVLGIQWGSWDGIGLAQREGGQRSIRAYQQQGIRPLSLAEALEALDNLIAQKAASALVLPVDWPKYAESFAGAIPSLFEDLVPRQRAPETRTQPVRERFLAAESADERLRLMEAEIVEKLASVLKTLPSKIDRQKPFGALGLDSLMALEMVRRLAESTAVRVPVTTVFNFPTVARLSAELAARIGGNPDLPLPTARIEPGIETPLNLETLSETLSEDDAIAALMGDSGTNP